MDCFLEYSALELLLITAASPFYYNYLGWFNTNLSTAVVSIVRGEYQDILAAFNKRLTSVKVPPGWFQWRWSFPRRFIPVAKAIRARRDTDSVVRGADDDDFVTIEAILHELKGLGGMAGHSSDGSVSLDISN